MSFLDVVKRSMRTTDERSSPSMNRKAKENASAKDKVPSSQRPRQAAYSDVDSSSRSSRDSGKPQRIAPNTRSRFSQLSCEITQFQKMVRELESLVTRSGDTPEDQWRSRIVLRSAEEADTDIGKKIRHQEQAVLNVQDPTVRASYQKLRRDYKRAHESFKTLSSQYTKRQQEAIVQLQGEHGFASPEEIRTKALAQHEVSVDE